jgi:hypothetical protein
MASNPAEARAKVDLAKKNVQDCEMEMQILKTKIRGLGTDGGDPNSLELAVLKVSDTRHSTIQSKEASSLIFVRFFLG